MLTGTSRFNVRTTRRRLAEGFTYQRGTTPRLLPITALWRPSMVTTRSETCDSTINHDVPHGMYAQLNDSVFKLEHMSQDNEGAYYWNR